MRLIDADEIYKEIIQAEDLAMDRAVNTNEMIGDRINPMSIRYSAQLGERTMFKYMIMDAQTVDAVPVIRCKDCKYYVLGHDDMFHCFKHDDDILWQDDSFCSFAERKEE